MKPNILLLAALFFAVADTAPLKADPVVSNVRAAQRAGTKLVDVYYDLSGADGPATVSVAVSDNGGSSYAVPATSLSGAVGGGVANGTNKHVVWNAGADWNGQFSQALKFRITASTVPDGFALIPAGSFTMGRTSGDTDLTDAPRVSVYVSAFYMAKYEVTKSLWDEVRTWGLANGYTDLPTGHGKAANHPVHSISWHAVVKWCNARSQKEGLTACYTVSEATYRTGSNNAVVCNWAASGYRLPSEAEWEKAARGGQSGFRYPWGSHTISHAQANYYASGTSYGNLSGNVGYHPSYTSGGSPYTSPVGSFAGNGFGLHDMTGNVMEWCWDWYSESYYTGGASDPKGPSSGTGRVLRGGCWLDDADYCRAAIRNSATPVAVDNVGFRPARSSVP